MQQAVVHWCEILNYRGKQRERGTAALGMLKQEDGTSDTAGNSAFPHSLSYIALCLQKQVMLKLAQAANPAFCNTSFRKVSFLLL